MCLCFCVWLCVCVSSSIYKPITFLCIQILKLVTCRTVIFKAKIACWESTKCLDSEAPIHFPYLHNTINSVIDYSFSFSRDVHFSEEKFSGPTLFPNSQATHLENKMRYSKSQLWVPPIKTSPTNSCLLPLLQPTFSAHCSSTSTPTLCL